MSRKVKIKKIIIIIGEDKELQLTLEEAHELQNELNNLFNDNVPLPYVPPYKIPDITNPIPCEPGDIPNPPIVICKNHVNTGEE